MHHIDTTAALPQDAGAAETALIAEYNAFLASNSLTPMCAEELLHEELTDAQRAWVSDFIIRWDATI